MVYPLVRNFVENTVGSSARTKGTSLNPQGYRLDSRGARGTHNANSKRQISVAAQERIDEDVERGGRKLLKQAQRKNSSAANAQIVVTQTYTVENARTNSPVRHNPSFLSEQTR
jgi:hypothetical protein